MPNDSESAPVLTGQVWWSLRDRFVQKLPASMNAGYLISALNMQEVTARTVLANLKKLALLDENGVPTDLANRWRDDSEYPAVCEEILAAAYPTELREAAPGPKPDSAVASRWFQQRHRMGKGAADNAARTYVLIASGDLGMRGKKQQSSAKSSNASVKKAQRHTEGRSSPIPLAPPTLRDMTTPPDGAAPADLDALAGETG